MWYNIKKKKKSQDGIIWQSSHLNLELATYDWLNHTQRLSNQAAAYIAIQRQPEWIILWEKKKRLGIRGDEKRQKEKRRGNNSPVAASDKSCVLKPSWTCSILSVVWASRLYLGPLQTESMGHHQYSFYRCHSVIKYFPLVCVSGTIVILTV